MTKKETSKPVLLRKKGNLENCHVQLTNQEVTTEKMCQLFSQIEGIKKGSGKPDLLGKISQNKKNYYFFGWKDGQAGQENHHDLPPPLDNELYCCSILLRLFILKSPVLSTVDSSILYKSDGSVSNRI